MKSSSSHKSNGIQLRFTNEKKNIEGVDRDIIEIIRFVSIFLRIAISTF